ncbi:MAG: phage tail tip lysozyme [Byssovorax sp.]
MSSSLLAHRLWSKRFLPSAFVLPVLLAGCMNGSDSAPDEGVDDQTDEIVTENANDKIAFDFFLAKGLTPVQAAGIVGNLDQESGMSPTIAQYGGGPGRGIAQWSAGGRWDTDYHDNVAWYAGQKGKSIHSLELQLEFIWYELTTFGYGLSQLKAAKSINASVAAFQDHYEICGQCASANRIAHAKAALAAFGGDGAPPPPAQSGLASLGGSIAGDPAVGANADGRLEVFALGPKGNMVTTFQTEPNGGWSGWFSLGGNLEGRPAVANNEDGRIELFARSAGNTLEHAWQDSPNGKIGNFATMGGTWTSDPTVARNEDGRLEVFAIGNDGALHHAYQVKANGGWSGFSSLGSAGGGLSEPRAIRAQDGKLRVFAIGKDEATYVIAQESGGWSAWTSLGGKATSNPTVVKNADGRLEVFVRGTDGALFHQWEKTVNGAWSGWASFGGGIHRPFASTDADGRIELFARGDNQALYRIAQKAPNSGWGSWTKMGGEMTGGAAAKRNKDGRLEVFIRAADGSVQHAWESAPGKW